MVAGRIPARLPRRLRSAPIPPRYRFRGNDDPIAWRRSSATVVARSAVALRNPARFRGRHDAVNCSVCGYRARSRYGDGVGSPHLDRLEVRVIDAPTGPMLWVLGVAAEDIQENQETAIALETSSGSWVEVRLPRSICGTLSGLRICRRVMVMMREGRTVGEIHGFLADLDAAFAPASSVAGTAAGTVEVFTGSPRTVEVFTGSVSTARARIGGHPAVRFAEYEGTGNPGWDIPNHDKRYLRVAVPTRDSNPTPTSARLRLVPGDTVTVRYHQPDRTELTASTIVPAP